MEENTKKRFSFLIFILAAILLLLFSYLLSSEPKGSLPASPEESIVGSADEWIYYSLPPGKGAEMGLWRIHTETGEKEHIWEKYEAFFRFGGRNIRTNKLGRCLPNGSGWKQSGIDF